ncbi:hypothetical protein SAMN05444372_101146 [Flavobacterium micromati]|uniref:Uncharacterized protein n=1 Tax=Flavobacterium micromati TaxID=229205 RepID=A0A1M5FIK9_9FLAO|nr:hypothetical protein [Flavobacterium micromati]SHF91249.1 hypothetical protein SAMN05444372_101146 [Flavobacterium micromati]
MDKTIVFELYRFHLLPITTSQFSLFDEVISYDELVKKKNKFFDEIVQDLQNRTEDFPIELYSVEDNSYLFRLANPKTTMIYRNFAEIPENTEPYIYIIINTDPQVQKIAISRNPEAFSTPNVSKKVLVSIFSKYLKNYGLSIEFEQLFESKTFWSWVDKYHGRIKSIDFEIIKPNLSKISHTIKDTLKPLIESTNSHKTHLKLDAPVEGVLENIDKSNTLVDGLVEYSSEGGGNISMSVFGVAMRVKTDNMVTTKRISEINIKGSPDQVIKLWKNITE